jgi:4-hydroxy-2-oxoheptanedioate aldolase
MAKSPIELQNAEARSMGQPGRQLKSRLQAGEVLLCGMITEYLHPSLVKLYKHAGFDFIFFEYEHSFVNPSDLASTVLCARDNGLPVIAKTPQLERAEVAKLLECGVVGIQLPRTETRDEVETLRSYLKFPPHGSRAVMPGAGNSSYVPVSDWKSWMEEQDQETTLIVHIETKTAYENAEEIISTPGVDMVYLGAGDFSIEMGHPGKYDHPEVVGPMEEILTICQKHKVPFGTTASDMKAAQRWIARGAQFFEIIDEMSLILQGASKIVCDYRELTIR